MAGARRFHSRAVLCGIVAGLVFILAGDRGGFTAPPVGIDPLEILDLQVKNNVLFVFDTSGSMKWPTGTDNFSVGADDPMSRMYQAKQAVKAVVQQNAGKLNFGLLSYNIEADNKTLNRTQEFDNDNRLDGPFVYVSADFTASNPFYQTYFCPTDGVNRDGFFCRTSDTFTSYNGTNSLEVFQSFQNRSGGGTGGNGFFDDPYPPGCNAFDPATSPEVDLTHCRFYLQSKLFRSGVRYTWNLASNDNNSRLVNTQTTTCPLPPAGLVGDNPDANLDGLADRPTPCIQMVDQATGQVATFFYSSAIFQSDGGTNFCGGAATLAPVSDCAGDNTQVILDNMRQELPVVDANTLTGLPPANTIQSYTTGIDPAPPAGMRADQSTPIAASLNDIRTNAPVFPPRPPQVANVQRNFVIFLSDGDDTCASSNLDTAATIAAREAELLYYQGGGPGPANTDPQHQAETMFVAFASAINIARSNKIAQAGSGGNVQPDGTVVCPDDVPCRDAFTATTTQELIDALNAALQFAVSSGTFAASATTLATVFELIVDDPTSPPVEDPFDPATRYNRRVNILFQPTFDLPGWKGHLYAFENLSFVPVPDTVNFTNNWDAGETLFENVSQVMEATTAGTGQPNQFTFAELHANATVDNIRTSNALIKRRIFTSDGHGRFPRTTDSQFDARSVQGRNVVALWPPSQTGLTNSKGDIDPAVGVTGPLDVALGIDNLTYDALKSEFGACDGSTDPISGPVPTGCDNLVDPVLAEQVAQKEARQVILAYTAGARVDRSNQDAKPLRNSSGELLYRDRGWLLTESTLSQPAVITPPFRNQPDRHVREYLLYRDGRRDQSRQGIPEVDLGFGLRNPDIADVNPAGKLDLKPVMTVVYIGSNVMLHAFKAQTSEELWGFVPYDQLGKLRDARRPQTRDDKTYVVSTSVRFESIFVPGPFTIGGTDFDGRWRNMLIIGRGPGGKYYTAIDVTAPGPFTREALDANPPWVMWSRGNPDTVDGTLAGTPIRAADTVAYSQMGQTWSIPAIGNVKPAPSPMPNPSPLPPPGGFGPEEWRVFTGSGFGDNPGEGTTFYVLDAVTGDVIWSRDVGDGANTYFSENALVASSAAYNPFFLDNITTATFRSQDAVTRVYIPDIHGRIWKFAAGTMGQFADMGPSQPFGDGVALLKMLDLVDPPPGEKAFVFAAAGNDNRVAPPPAATPPFRMFAFKDVGGDDLVDPVSGNAAVQVFSEDFPSPFRGSSRPATFFNVEGKGRVAYAGSRFNPPDATCLSSFDTILFVLGAQTGSAVYDFGSGYAKSTIIEDIKDDIRASGGQLTITDSGSRTRAPQPPSPQPSPPGSTFVPAEVKTLIQTTGTPVCR